MADLRKDYQYFLDNKKELVEKYGGMYILISNCEVVKAFADENDAYYYGGEHLGLGNFIIQLCTDAGYEATFHSRVRINNAAV